MTISALKREVLALREHVEQLEAWNRDLKHQTKTLRTEKRQLRLSLALATQAQTLLPAKAESLDQKATLSQDYGMKAAKAVDETKQIVKVWTKEVD